MRIGIASTDFSAMPYRVLLDRVEAYGFEILQLSLADIVEVGFIPNGEIEIPSALDLGLIESIAQEFRRRSLPVVALNGTYNMAHPDAAVRKEGLRRLEGLAQAAQVLESPLISLCTGTRNRAHLWRPHPDNQTAQAWADMMASLEQALELAQRYDLTLALETEAANVLDTPEKARAALDALGSPRLKMILDGANLFHPGQAKAENVEPILCHAVELFGQDIALAHGKDIRASQGIEFCGPGEGILDFELMLRLLKAQPCDMILHGIAEEARMPAACKWMGSLRAAVFGP